MFGCFCVFLVLTVQFCWDEEGSGLVFFVCVCVCCPNVGTVAEKRNQQNFE